MDYPSQLIVLYVLHLSPLRCIIDLNDLNQGVKFPHLFFAFLVWKAKTVKNQYVKLIVDIQCIVCKIHAALDINLLILTCQINFVLEENNFKVNPWHLPSNTKLHELLSDSPTINLIEFKLIEFSMLSLILIALFCVFIGIFWFACLYNSKPLLFYIVTYLCGLICVYMFSYMSLPKRVRFLLISSSWIYNNLTYIFTVYPPYFKYNDITLRVFIFPWLLI